MIKIDGRMLVVVEDQIYNQYKKLEKAKDDEEDRIIKDLEFLFELENDILEPIMGFRSEIENYKNGLGKIISSSKLPMEIKEKIQERLKRYLIEYYFRNPFPSNIDITNTNDTEFDKIHDFFKALSLAQKSIKENASIIREQCYQDSLKRLLYYLDIEIEKSKNKRIKRKLKKEKYKLLQKHKLVEKHLTTPITQEELTDSSRSIRFYHNPELVNDVYSVFLSNVIHTNIDKLKDCIQKKGENNRVNYTLMLIELKIALELLDLFSFVDIGYEVSTSMAEENETKATREVKEAIAEEFSKRAFQKEKKD